jgi:hypothetical protein
VTDKDWLTFIVEMNLLRGTANAREMVSVFLAFLPSRGCLIGKPLA